jgi:chemosensory pili system protein ChpA (sensor histidine kinase/response regulator)
LELIKETPEALAQHIATEPLEAQDPEGVSAFIRRFKAENPDIWEFFAPEVEEIIEQVEGELRQLEDNPTNPEATKNLFRALHTLKGAAYSVGCQPIGQLAHRMEDLLVEVRDGKRQWGLESAMVLSQGAKTFEAMLATGPDLEAMLQATEQQLAWLLGKAAPEAAASPVPAPQPTPAPTPAPSQADKASNPANPASKTATEGTIRLRVGQLDNLMELAGQTVSIRARLQRMQTDYGELARLMSANQGRLSRLAESVQRYMNPRLQAEQKEETYRGQETPLTDFFSELELDRYDDLNILANSVVELADDLSQVRGQLDELNQGLGHEIETTEKLSQNLRSEVGRARLVPLKRLYQRLERLARQTKDKKISFSTQGENVELDTQMLENLTEPLLHLVNNALAHGIETPEARRARGKPEVGQVQVRAAAERSYVTLQVEDDGAGIPVERLKEKAIERGLLSPDVAFKMGGEEAVNLVFIPGLSTQEETSQAAGRGVGMDAVRASLERIGGEIQIETLEGHGTRVSLKIPSTLLLSKSLLVEIAGQTYGIPSPAVRAVREYNRREQFSLEDDLGFIFQDQWVSVYSAHSLLGLPKPQTHPPMVILEALGRIYALQVDRFVGLEDVVVRPLGELLSPINFVMGASVDPSDRVILMLDPSGLLRLSQESVLEPTLAFQPPTPAKPLVKRLPLLLADDSLSVRKVVGQMIRKRGLEVVLASDGKEAMDLLETQSFSALITDLEMPRMNGLELIQEVRRRPSLSGLPVAVLTTRTSAKHRGLALELGANAYLGKPADEDQLTEFLNLTAVAS